MVPPTLLAAAEAGDVTAVIELLAAGASAAGADSAGTTPLMLAARAGHAPVVDCLLAGSADVSARNRDGATALILASAASRVECGELILRSASGASPVERDTQGRSPLWYAARLGDCELLGLLIAAIAVSPALATDSIDVADQAGLTPLMVAAHSGQLDALRQLRAAGASVFRADGLGWSALHAAAHSGHLVIAQDLLAAGARADSRDRNGRTPADVATTDELRALITAAHDEQYENWSEKSYDSAQDDRPWH